METSSSTRPVDWKGPSTSSINLYNASLSLHRKNMKKITVNSKVEWVLLRIAKLLQQKMKSTSREGWRKRKNAYSHKKHPTAVVRLCSTPISLLSTCITLRNMCWCQEQAPTLALPPTAKAAELQGVPVAGGSAKFDCYGRSSSFVPESWR